MTNRSKPRVSAASGRVSPTAPEFVSPSYQSWEAAKQDPVFRADVKAGLKDAADGRTTSWHEIRQRIQSS